MKHYEAYLFDWDGTLAQSHDMWLSIMHRQLRRHNITVSDGQIVKQLFGRYEEGLREFGFSEVEIKALTKELQTIAKQQFPLVDLFPGAQDVLNTLRQQGKKVALVTASYRDVINVAVGNHKLLDFFDIIITGDEMKAQKPDPSGLLLVLEKLKIAPSRAIMIGDSPKDLLAGNNAGTDTLLFYPPEHESQHPLSELQSCKPTYTIHSWQEFFDRLQ
ncbi:MAG TPA: HAD family hydrolase [Candidatus Saccharimonadales bacterium]|nr:HAD family hydrolase [Candidatus Saccharimonadales bacterium]